MLLLHSKPIEFGNDGNSFGTNTRKWNSEIYIGVSNITAVLLLFLFIKYSF